MLKRSLAALTVFSLLDFGPEHKLAFLSRSMQQASEQNKRKSVARRRQNDDARPN